MRWKVPSSKTGSDDSASAAAERDSGVLDGLTAACAGFAATGGLAATAGLFGRLGRRAKALRQRRTGGKRHNDPGNRNGPHQSASPARLPYWYGGISTNRRFCRLGDSIGSKLFHHLAKA